VPDVTRRAALGGLVAAGAAVVWPQRVKHPGQPRGGTPGLTEVRMDVSGPEGFDGADSGNATSSFSNANAGTGDGTNYRYEGVTSTGTHNHLTFAFLAGRPGVHGGWKAVKIPVRWERLTRNTSALTPDTLNSAEMALLDTEITEAGSQGYDVIIDVHNYGQYYADGAQGGIGGTAGTGYAQALGYTSAGVTWTTAFTSFWSAMATHYLNNTTVTGFCLMNEPNSSWGGTNKLTLAGWQAASQSAVTAIRAVDTAGRFTIRVNGMEWGACRNWAAINGSGWITDPVAPANIWYDAHHYWDENGSGIYTTYATAVAKAVSNGYTSTFQGTPYPDALYSERLDDLYQFKQWLISNGGHKGVIGEMGVPNQNTVSAGDETSWTSLLAAYLKYAASLGGIGVNAWDCGEWQGGWSNQLSCYADSNRFVSGVDTAGTISLVWEQAL
jgi:aryl-phospho-beta-D-glucosidase BglC (GH1 family)